jgi:hypothetical protein
VINDQGKPRVGVLESPAGVGALPAFYPFYDAKTGGTQTEGSNGTIAAYTGTSPEVLLLPGYTASSYTDDALCEWTGTRWVSDRFGVPLGTGTVIPGCPCNPVPSPLTMTVSNASKNYGIFQNATLQYYSPVPSQFSTLSLGTFAYLSTSSFTDQFSTNPFWYYFTCYQGYYALSRVYPKTSTGPAYVDSIRYRWLAGSFGNTCSPFSLTSGAIFAGGDSSCVVTITG